MSDCRKSTPCVPVPPELQGRDSASPFWLPDSALRGTFAVRLRHEERAALQSIAERVLDLTQSAYLIYPDHRLATIGDMQGAADDLYHVAGFLGYVLGSVAASSPEPAELRLLVAAETIGPKVEALAKELEAAVAAEVRS